MGFFETVYDRKNTRSVKWDMLDEVFNTSDVLPMWVADMDFRAPKEVTEALLERVKHEIFGYTVIDKDVKASIVNWVARRHHWEINPEWLSFSPGVVTTLHMAVQALTNPNDSILIQTPVYTPFYKVIEEHERKVVKSPLIRKGDTYAIDFEDFEEKLKQGVKAFILCNPHNPVGRVWKYEELKEIARLCLKYNVFIISDEIHGDLVFPDKKHIPIGSLSEEIANCTITCMAPSKTFNLAGLQASYAVTANPELRKKLDHHFTIQGIHGLNTLGNTALEAAYNFGEPWLNELQEVLVSHHNYVKEELEAKTDLQVIQSEGTYLLWIDCKSLNMDDKALHSFFIEQAKVGLNKGIDYGVEGSQFMRMNIACPKEILVEGVQRIIDAVTNR
ncbi:MalY/PatB family protein [Ornithinibacillus bavariensis]|uniref:MalY/PatB family protein n=1 Tax=Ornithinibacillus bavariensis TaxID=545502 RepID=UPI000EC894F6|nr:cystathionine beta-lyase [Ornithinibacillus sp.]